ncbi:MAG: hypothetical protein IT488_03220 [Gammaproteobacteria bacterium]|nr:hypothetical protein [Gammaproteobacteria bacterium]
MIPVAAFEPQCMPDFAPLLERFDRKALDNNSGTVYGVWPDFTLAYANSEWFRFAAKNGCDMTSAAGSPLGGVILDAVSADLQPYYRSLFALAGIRDPRISVPLCHEYDCSSPTEYRRFAMHIYSLDDLKGYLVINSLLIQRPHAPGIAVRAPGDEEYVDMNGFFCQCSHCRRFRRNGPTERWDWIPQWVERQPSRTSHGLCRICFDYYYPKTPPD